MTDSRKQFDEWWVEQRFYGDSMLEKQAWEAWQEGRASMREDVIEELKDYGADKCAQIAAGIEV